MLKGVNKLIVDVANPDSEFFERAIFFVKPQMRDTPTKELNRGADSLIFRAGKRSRKRHIPTGIALIFAAGGGAAIAVVFLTLLS